ncbi:unnamed protein product [Mytilus edulis]|uniref:Uncharacterized protein n=1 Tax=Mytilus edulis TaxID=6550 RepID=A0A8S3QKA0_MYTED|nr:unnamed protein product [Mytilus edulis]
MDRLARSHQPSIDSVLERVSTVLLQTQRKAQCGTLDAASTDKELSELIANLSRMEGTIDDMDGSCGFNFTSSDTNKARNTFNDYIYDKTVSVVYMSLQEKCLDQTNLNTYLSEETERNGLQEWIWLRKEMRYEALSLPIDLDSLTFTITKYGTRQMDIPWSLSIYCHLNSRISYENETKHILKYLWSSITQNETGSLLCHRSFDDNTLRGTTAIWYITTVWIGYDFDCYLIDSLMNDNFDVTEQSKYDITKILTVVLGLLAYMHPFIIHFIEIMQPNENTDLDKYYKKKDQYEKPYGITRVMQKIFFTPWRGRDPGSDNAVKYAPIVRFYIFWTLIVFGFNYYKLRINNQEVFEKAEYTNFPTIYRYGIPEYQFLKHIKFLPLSVSIMSYFVCNVWIYILYNETDDFIICFGKNICCCRCTCDGRSKYICCVPVKDIMETEENTDEHRWMLKAISIFSSSKSGNTENDVNDSRKKQVGIEESQSEKTQNENTAEKTFYTSQDENAVNGKGKLSQIVNRIENTNVTSADKSTEKLSESECQSRDEDPENDKAKINKNLTSEKKKIVNKFLDSYAVLLDTIFDIHETKMDQRKAEEKRDESSNSRNSIDEDLFDYIVDNCYTARKDRDEQHPMTDFENPREHDNTSVKTFSVDGTENGTEDKKCKNRPQGQDKFKVPHLKGQTKKSICSDPTEATPLIN